MTLSTSLLAFQDCLEAYDKAIADERGARIPVDSHEAAQHLRARLHQCRKLHRQQNALAYEPDHPMHGNSQYDEITVRIRQSRAERVYVYLEKVRLGREEIEALSEVDEEVVMIPPPRQQVLPPQPVMKLLENFKRRV